LMGAFRDKDLKQIRSLWPDLSKGEQELWKQKFDAVKQYSRKLKVNKIQDRGVNEKEVFGSFSDEELSTDGVRKVTKGNFDARVVRQNDRWTIQSINWTE